MSVLKDALLLVGIAAGLAGASYVWHPHRPALYQTEEKAEEGEITVSEAQKLAAGGKLLWIDARRRQEYEKGHIPGALLLNEYEWHDLLVPAMEPLNAAQEGKVVVYCDASKCTASKSIAAQVRDFFPVPENVLVLRGGWPAWQAAQK
jgi:rhodanese-related sulfurtransferase